VTQHPSSVTNANLYKKNSLCTLSISNLWHPGELQLKFVLSSSVELIANARSDQKCLFYDE
jgi:hypothetical protein